ncbi:universal stress protein [Planococcus sp. FY231025]|uniref:universal stress protein n=1 Tax=Planococcus sp. FY231025 TaxID=3455699 RepID=UPI003F91C98E
MTLQYNTILVAIDGSKEAELAFKKSVAIASRNNAALHLVSIIDISFGSLEAYAREYARETKKSTEELLQRYKQEATEAGISNVNIIIELGSPKTMIPGEIATRIDADLIICGATGLNAAERIFLGSVSDRIVRAAKCDVLVVRNQDTISE